MTQKIIRISERKFEGLCFGFHKFFQFFRICDRVPDMELWSPASGAGLTASAVRNEETGNWQAQAGLAVHAHNGKAINNLPDDVYAQAMRESLEQIGIKVETKKKPIIHKFYWSTGKTFCGKGKSVGFPAMNYWGEVTCSDCLKFKETAKAIGDTGKPAGKATGGIESAEDVSEPNSPAHPKASPAAEYPYEQQKGEITHNLCSIRAVFPAADISEAQARKLIEEVWGVSAQIVIDETGRWPITLARKGFRLGAESVKCQSCKCKCQPIMCEGCAVERRLTAKANGYGEGFKDGAESERKRIVDALRKWADKNEDRYDEHSEIRLSCVRNRADEIEKGEL